MLSRNKFCWNFSVCLWYCAGLCYTVRYA